MKNVIVKFVTVVMKMRKVSLAKIIVSIESVLLKMENNSHFLTPNPPLADVEEQKNELVEAMATAKEGSDADKALVRVKFRAIKLTMTALKDYVQTTANADAVNAEEIVLSSGMDLKRFTPRGKQKFKLTHTNISGKIKVTCPRDEKALLFDFEYTLTPDDEKSYKSIGVRHAAKRFISDLTPLGKLYVRWASITSEGYTDWSEPMSIVIV